MISLKEARDSFREKKGESPLPFVEQRQDHLLSLPSQGVVSIASMAIGLFPVMHLVQNGYTRISKDLPQANL